MIKILIYLFAASSLSAGLTSGAGLDMAGLHGLYDLWSGIQKKVKGICQRQEALCLPAMCAQIADP